MKGYRIAGAPQRHLGDLAPDDARMAGLQIAMGMTGAHAPDNEYMDIIGPYESARMKKDMATMSGCGLVARAYLRFLGFRTFHFAPPYMIGNAFQDVSAYAYEHDCFSYSLERSQMGAIVCMGGGTAAHMAVFLAVNSYDEKPYAWTVDGGQVDSKGRQRITYRRRAIEMKDGVILSFERRKVNWTLDPLDLSEKIGASLPWAMPLRDTAPEAPPPGFHFGA